MLPDYQRIFRKYNEQLKPLISEIEGRLEHFCPSLLLNLAAVFDYMSIAAVEGQDSPLLMKNADSYLDLCISQSYMTLIYAIKKNTDAFEKDLGKKGMSKLDNGRFIGHYTELKKRRNTLLKKAKNMKEEEALPIFKEIYEVVTKMEEMVNHEKSNISIIQSEVSSWASTCIKWGLSIAISVFVGGVVKYYLE